MTRRTLPVLALLLALLPSHPVDAAGIPDLDGFRTRLSRAEALAEKAHAVGAVASRIQNELTTRIYLRTLTCDDETSSLLGRQRHLGHVYRDLLQTWRVEVGALQEERQLPTVAPLVVPADQERLEALMTDLNGELELWRTFAAWQRSRVEPWAGACPAQLAPTDGLPPWNPHDPLAHKTVVIGAGPGTICPANVPADGAVVLVDGAACYEAPATSPDGASCTCTPEPVTDGAVLGEAS